MKTDYTYFYEAAVDAAMSLMDVGVEPTSAFKQAASDQGIPYGDEMEKFVAYALNSFGC